MSAERSGTAGHLSVWVGAAAGIGAYLIVLGGIIQWARFSAADLPADTLLLATSTPRLIAIGLRSFAVLPVAVVGLLVFFWIIERVERRPSLPKRPSSGGNWVLRIVLAALLVLCAGALAWLFLIAGWR